MRRPDARHGDWAPAWQQAARGARQAATSLIGLQVTTDAEFEHCQRILQKHRDRFRLINPEARYLVVRRSDTHLFAEAGLSYREIELIELDDLPPEERYERQRVLIQEHMPRTTSHAT